MFTTPLRRLLLGAAVVAAVACGGDSVSGVGSLAGSYSLQTVNGKVLPYVVLDTVDQGTAVKVEIVSPTTLTLESGSNFRLILTSKVTFAGFSDVAADTIAGTYTRAGSSLTLTAPGQPALSGTWNMSDQVTLSGDGDVLVFKRS